MARPSSQRWTQRPEFQHFLSNPQLTAYLLLFQSVAVLKSFLFLIVFNYVNRGVHVSAVPPEARGEC